MTITEALEELKQSPGLLDHIARLEQIIKDERKRRKQFYRDVTADQKTEFINGQVIIHSPARRPHLRATLFITTILNQYVTQHRLGEVYVEKCMIRCERNDYEPDVCFFGTAKCAELDEEQLLFPPPDLAVEVLSPSTERNDRTVKLLDYARHGVSEYWIVDAGGRAVEQYVLPPGMKSYELKTRLAESEQLVSIVLPGFNIPVAAFFDVQSNQGALQALTATKGG